MYKESTNAVVKHLINRLRDVRTASNEFRLTIEEISRMIVAEALADFPTITTNINTWQGPLDVEMLEVQKIVLVPILRAGEPMLTGILQTLPYARSGFLAMKRDEETSLSKLFYENIPDNLEDKTVLLLDPMIATGGSLIDGIDYLKGIGAKRIISLNILGSPYGIQKVQEVHPDVDIYIAQIDERLDENNYIRPGLGDAGDRAFNTK
ncbi:uracil phosphoribosyltransferase [Malaciobacter marinus]|uniref:Uracil phosphoribosyltransferase n=1 Tax=Malaciobacter marinus TaxID=505249 RepID=A0A347TLW5_9BACT|nr:MULTISPECIES: uracil phosphoribosyltransferase [Malaciobacter]AXX87593.1 uracil phosphoribosyltransferase [Malaciobacter marinus]PHO12208.1 uracil phosphoribosyltransferase [Malaciobacter marinus]PHO14303.1 uracil phosphoribosyltransferase [Malaciobacter marinus]RYA24850.1 uracil phosphoribosyltransferase [Malaciobacter halophilus]